MRTTIGCREVPDRLSARRAPEHAVQLRQVIHETLEFLAADRPLGRPVVHSEGREVACATNAIQHGKLKVPLLGDLLERPEEIGSG